MIDEIQKHLDFLKASAGETWRCVEVDPQNQIQVACTCLLRRVDEVSNGVAILFKEYETNSSLDLVLSSLFRSILSDIIIGLSIMQHSDKADQNGLSFMERAADIDNYCRYLLADGLTQANSYIQYQYDHFGMSDKQKEAELVGLKERFGEYYVNVDKKTGERKPPSINLKNLATELSKTAHLNEISRVYNTYMEFSKIDHFGILYSRLIDVPQERNLHQYLGVIKSMLAHNAWIHMLLCDSVRNDYLLFKREQTVSYLLNMSEAL